MQMSAGACEGFGVDSVATETHNSALSRMSHVVWLDTTLSYYSSFLDLMPLTSE